ncbi:acyl-CoA dehydrogenase family protein [Frisingicoccus sp.]|uniref:acyl-CoA dehydrogenase family protein n=1 Tax=Frisingicoccus sp. TaxID=1918627 RepID=UPI00399BA466
MDFELTQEYKEDIAYYKEFAKNEILPLYQFMEENAATPDELLVKMKDAQLLGIPMPKAYGGLGKDFLSATFCMEELSKVSPATAGIINVTTEIVSAALEKYGTDAQKEKYLIPLAKGEAIGAFALTEAGAGSDAAGVRTKAVLKDDHWVLNGTKCFITNAEISSIFLIAALTDVGDGKRKISMFIVEKDYPGFKIGKHEDKMGIRSSSTCELIMEDCTIPKDNLLGEPGKGLKIALGGLDGGRVMIAAQGLGIAQGCWDMAVDYLKTHVLETENAINQQAVQFKLAELQTRIEAARLLVYHAAALWSQGKPFGKEAAMAKFYATELANEVTKETIQVMGYEGCTYGNLTEELFRDAKISEIYEGTNEIQLMVIAGQLKLKA